MTRHTTWMVGLCSRFINQISIWCLFFNEGFSFLSFAFFQLIYLSDLYAD